METAFENVQKISSKNPIIVYDGDCKFCNFWVQYLLKKDTNHIFYFTDRHHSSGKLILEDLGGKWKEADSILVYYQNEAFIFSDAVRVILNQIHHPLRWIFNLGPKFILDSFYKIIAKYRHKIFGFEQACIIPNSEQQTRFL